MSDGGPVLLFDFDGVFCDSTRECFAVAMLASEMFRRCIGAGEVTPSRVRDLLFEPPAGPEWDYFARYRPFVRWPREYLLILRNAESGFSSLSQEDFDAFEASDDADRLSFQSAFFSARGFLAERHRGEWLDLFEPYHRAVEGARHLASRFDHRILTGRDGASARHVLERAGWVVSEHLVYDATRFRSKVEGFDAIRADFAEPRRFGLIDDNITHLERLMQRGVTPFLATWGYVTPEHERMASALAGVVHVAIDDWVERVEEVMMGSSA